MKIRFVLFLVIFSFVFSGLKAQVDVGDSLALVDLYNGMKGPGWTDHTNWLTKKPVSKWFGVEVTNTHVTGILLNFNNLKGYIPESIGNFDSLLNLQLGSNKCQGGIPATIGKLKTLQKIFLSFSGLTGPLPATLGDLPDLIGFQAAGNYLTGEIPASLGNCRHLSILYLSENGLTGSIPSSFKKLTELTKLELARNHLSGSVPNVFPVQGMLTELYLLGNDFSGSVPSFLGKLSTLTYLSLSENKLTGKIPAELSNITNLNTLDLSRNQLTGSIPGSFSAFPRNTTIYLSENLLTETNNPQASDGEIWQVGMFIDYNHFTFNGLEYLAKKLKNVFYSYQAPLAVHAFNGGLAISAGGSLSNNTYRWHKTGNAGTVMIIGDSTYRPTSNGKYYAYVTNSVAADLVLQTDTFIYVMPVVKSELKISISPNPARGMISIHGLDDKSNTKITVADMSGYVWMKVISRQQSTLQVNVSHLKAGNYLVNVNNGKEVKAVMFVKE